MQFKSCQDAYEGAVNDEVVKSRWGEFGLIMLGTLKKKTGMPLCNRFIFVHLLEE